MKPAWTMIALMSGALPVISGCGTGEANTGTAPVANEESTPLPVMIDVVRTGPIDAVYEATANLEALERASVVARIEGEIIEILVEEGALVSAGQVLARLEPARLRLKADRARAERDKLRQEYKRNLLLHERGLVSPRDYEDLAFQVKAAEAAYDLALLELSYAEVKAPIAGVVSERFAKTGNRLSAGEPLFVVTNTASLVAYVHVPQGELAKFAPAQSVSIRADALPSLDFRGQIERVSPIVDAATGTAKLTVAVDDESLLRPGMFVRLGLVYATHEQALLVPRDALDDEDGETRVWVIEDDKASGRSVATGLRSSDWVEITSGLTDGERLIVEGLQGLREGTRIAAAAREPRPKG
jgi:membrane fusion protein (multidrug efflux system)